MRRGLRLEGLQRIGARGFIEPRERAVAAGATQSVDARRGTGGGRAGAGVASGVGPAPGADDEDEEDVDDDEPRVANVELGAREV